MSARDTLPLAVIFSTVLSFLVSHTARAEAEFSASVRATYEFLDLSLISSGRLVVCDPLENLQLSDTSTPAFEADGDALFFFTPAGPGPAGEPCLGEGGLLLSTVMELTATASGRAEWDGGADPTIESGAVHVFGVLGLLNTTPDPLEVPIRVTAFAEQSGSVNLSVAEFAESLVALNFIGSRLEGIPDRNLFSPGRVELMPALFRNTREPFPHDAFDIISTLFTLGVPQDYTLVLPPSFVVNAAGDTIEIVEWTVGLRATAGGSAYSRFNSGSAGEALTFIPEFAGDLSIDNDCDGFLGRMNPDCPCGFIGSNCPCLFPPAPFHEACGCFILAPLMTLCGLYGMKQRRHWSRRQQLGTRNAECGKSR